ncbi:General secretion pathway M protein [Candidatus Magnetoovum chiemensis]|nr:General secretion pathway M protein [Candidatus Magnetoovum chiemensis]
MSVKTRNMGIFIIVVMSLIRLIALPLNHSIEKKQDILKETLNTLSAKETLLTKYKTLNENSTEHFSYKIDDLLYGSDVNKTALQTDFLNFVMRTAQESSLEVKSFVIEPSAETDMFTDVSVSIRCKGEPKNIMTLLTKLHNARPLISIRELRIDNKRDGYSSNITVTTYINKTS